MIIQSFFTTNIIFIIFLSTVIKKTEIGHRELKINGSNCKLYNFLLRYII